MLPGVRLASVCVIKDIDVYAIRTPRCLWGFACMQGSVVAGCDVVCGKLRREDILKIERNGRCIKDVSGGLGFRV